DKLSLTPETNPIWIQDGYVELLGRLVRSQYGGLREPQEFQELLGLCRAASKMRKVEPLILACFVECLCRNQDPADTADLQEARKVTLDESIAPEDKRYVLFAQALRHDRSGEFTVAADRYIEAFDNRFPAQPWQNAARRELAATALDQAGKYALRDHKQIA